MFLRQLISDISDKERSAYSVGHDVGNIEGYYEGYDESYSKAKSKCEERINEVNRKAESECAARCKSSYNKVVENFPLDKMSKKCLKKLRVDLHPDKFECYNEIKDFYNDVQKRYE